MGQATPFLKGIYEVAIYVSDLDRAERFYKDVLGVTDGLMVDERGMRFFRAGGEAGMFVLKQAEGDVSSQHFAFTIEESQLEEARIRLGEAGVRFEETYHDWMPGTSIYFSDPDGHDAELFAPRVALTP